MKKNIAIAVMAGLAVYFFFLWQATDMRLNLRERRVAQLAETIAGQMKTGQENFEWREFVRKAGVEKLLAKSLEGADDQKQEDIRAEIEERLLGYSREINVAESRRELIQILLQSPTGKVYLASFMAEAKETIRVYEEERK